MSYLEQKTISSGDNLSFNGQGFLPAIDDFEALLSKWIAALAPLHQRSFLSSLHRDFYFCADEPKRPVYYHKSFQRSATLRAESAFLTEESMGVFCDDRYDNSAGRDHPHLDSGGRGRGSYIHITGHPPVEMSEHQFLIFLDIREVIHLQIPLSGCATHTIFQWVRHHKGRVVFTNGCFDILHPGHLKSLRDAAAFGDFLVIGLNSDSSIRLLDKADDRPIQDLATRRAMLYALEFVHLVIPFDEATPLELIQAVKPDILVKGGDYELSEIVGSDFVLDGGGSVETIPLLQGYSTTSFINRVRGLQPG